MTFTVDASRARSGDTAISSAPSGNPAGTAPVTVAAFDVDGTLLSGDSLRPFLRFAGGWAWWVRALRAFPALALFAFGLTSRTQAKGALLRAVLGHLPQEALSRLADLFARRSLPGMIRREALARVHWHQAQHHHVVLVSASPELYLRPLAQTLGIPTVIGTRLAVSSGRVTGIHGLNCAGPEKVRRLFEYLPAAGMAELYAYGDSSGDHELLEVSTYPHFRTFSPQEKP